MSAAQSEAAVERVAGKRRELGEGDFSAYAFLALGLLGWNAPGVLQFILDRADAAVGQPETTPTRTWDDVRAAARAAVSPCDAHPWGDEEGLPCQGSGPGHSHRFAASDAPDRHSTTEGVQT